MIFDEIILSCCFKKRFWQRGKIIKKSWSPDWLLADAAT
jgi:hypothetical protein